MTSLRFDPGSTSIRPQKPWTSPFYGSMNDPGLKTLFSSTATNALMVFWSFLDFMCILVILKGLG